MQAEAEFARGNAHLDAEEFELAIERYQLAIRLQPDLTDAHENLGVAFANLGRMVEAVHCFHRVAQLKPNDPEPHLNLGLALMDDGLSDEAIGWFQRAIRLNPDYAEAHSNLGMAIHAKGHAGEAIAHYRNALRIKPDFAEAWNNLGVALRDRGESIEALNCFRRAMDLRPEFAEAANNLGSLLMQSGRVPDAISCFRRASELHPRAVEPVCNLGRAFKSVSKWEEAAECFDRACKLDARSTGALVGLGTVRQAQNDFAQAGECFRRAIEIDEFNIDAHQNLGLNLMAQSDFTGARDCFRRCIEIDPEIAEVHNNLGAAWRHLGRLDLAVACFERAIQIKPLFGDAHNNLGAVLGEQGRHSLAVEHGRRAIELKPESPACHGNLAAALHELGRNDESLIASRRAFELDSNRIADLGRIVHEMQHLGLWRGIDELTRKAIDAVESRTAAQPEHSIDPFTFLAFPTPTTAAQQRRCAEQFVATHVAPKCTALKERRTHRRGEHSDAIVLGYMSADFNEHAVGHVIAELIERHSRNAFRVHAYSIGPKNDGPMRRRLRQAFDEFVEIGELSYAEAADKIAADRVDILVDLMGFTRHARPAILAARPAPIQVNYLGFPGTMGADFMDFVLVDRIVVSPDQQPHFAEKLVYLRDCYQVNDRQRVVAERTPTRVECGLPADGFVFCCFNNSYKIARPTFEVWMDLLRETSGSVLWLWQRNRSVAANLRSEAVARNIAPERLVFMPRCEHADYLARYRLADLVLDTFPYPGHGTASDALWMGCPLVTQMGETFASRVAASLLTHVGLPELITTSLAQYRATALDLAHHPDRLHDIKTRLTENRLTCALFDTDRFVQNIEDVYRSMWQSYLTS